VSERFVRFSHPVDIVATLNSISAVVRSFNQLIRELVTHGPARTLPRKQNHPPHGESHLARRPNLNGHLIGGTADAPGLDLDSWLAVLERPMEDMERIFSGSIGDDVKGAVDDLLSDGLFSILHDHVHKLGDIGVTVLGVPHNGTLGYFATTGHIELLPL
jgi:hypothetical protein